MANQIVTVLEADGITETDLDILGLDRQAASASKSVALSTEDKTVLDAVAASVDGLETAVASTNTKLDTIAGHVDGLETAIASTNTKLDTAITALQIIDNMVLSAGTAAIGKLAANSGVDIGDVDVTSLPALVAGTANIGDVDIASIAGRDYETVIASQSAQVLGPTGATGDDIDGVLVVPASTSPGNVILLDNAISITIFTGGSESLSNLVPFYIPLGMRSVSGAWKITTGAAVSVIAVGNFT